MGTFTNQSSSKDFPRRTKGYLVKVTIPEELSSKTKTV